MCQLTLAGLKNNPKGNLIWTIIQGQINSEILNRDGWGIFFPDTEKYWKTEKPANTLIQLYGDLSKIDGKGSLPILSHVRHATKGSKKSLEEVHPFETNNFILFHNGTLEFDDPNEGNKEEFKNKIDSECFAILLQKYWDETNDMVKALNLAYSKMSGKFAFLIWNKKERQIYIVRGKTADLWMLDFGEKGVVINTQRDYLNRVSILMQNILQIDGFFIDVLNIDPVILPENSIFKLTEENKVEKIGEIVEKAVETPDNLEWRKWKNLGQKNPKQEDSKNPLPTSDNINLKIWYCIKDLEISLEYLDLYCYKLFSLGLLYLSKDEIKKLYDNLEAVRSKVHKKISSEWAKIKQNKQLSDIEVHETFKNLEFPYWENSLTDLRECKRS